MGLVYTVWQKGLKITVRKFWGLISTFVEGTGEKLVGGEGDVLQTPILNRVKKDQINLCKKDLSEINPEINELTKEFCEWFWDEIKNCLSLLQPRQIQRWIKHFTKGSNKKSIKIIEKRYRQKIHEKMVTDFFIKCLHQSNFKSSLKKTKQRSL